MTGKAGRLDIRPEQLAIVRELLKKHIPDREVLAFGSRAKGTARKYSDLDLAIMGNDPVTPAARYMGLKDDLTESRLPFMVDLVEWASLSDDWMLKAVRRDGIPVQEPAPGPRKDAPETGRERGA